MLRFVIETGRRKANRKLTCLIAILSGRPRQGIHQGSYDCILVEKSETV